MAATPAFATGAVANDPEYARQQPYFDRIRLTEAWGAAAVGRTVRVAIVDTGVDATHPDLAGRVLPGHDFVNNDADAHDDQWHGTWVAAIVAANTNNGVGIAGVSPSAQILPVKVLDAHGNGREADIAAGIRWAADQGAEVINLSLRAPGDSPAIREAVRHALYRRAVVVAAAGNSGSTDPQYPAAYPGVVAVAATDATGDLASFSARGPWVDIAAPGVNITSARSRSTYEAMSGTSYAAPIVAGVAALVRSVQPSAAGSQVVSRLLETARDAGPVGVDPYYGHGIIDAFAAVAPPTQAVPPPPLAPSAVVVAGPALPVLRGPPPKPGELIAQPVAQPPPSPETPLSSAVSAHVAVGKVTIPSKRGAVSRSGRARITLACSQPTSCDGQLTLTRRATVVGRAPFTIGPGHVRVVGVRLLRPVQRLLVAGKTFDVRAVVTATTARPMAARLVRLVVPKP